MRLAIRCHPCAPAALTEVETWLECEVERMRDELPDAMVRLLRLSPELSRDNGSGGWLIELEVDDRFMQSRRFDTVLGEMRLLGLQPDVLARRVRL